MRDSSKHSLSTQLKNNILLACFHLPATRREQKSLTFFPDMIFKTLNIIYYLGIKLGISKAHQFYSRKL